MGTSRLKKVIKGDKGAMKGFRPNKESHTSNDEMGMGDFYGTGVKNPMGKSVEIMGVKEISSKTMKKKPRALA